MSVEAQENLIKSMENRLELVICASGGNINYWLFGRFKCEICAT